MNRRLSTRLIAGLLVVVGPAGIITACGGSDDASDATSAAADTAVTVPEITAPTDTASDGAGSDVTDAPDATQTDDTETDATDDFSDLSVPANATGECAAISQQVVDALKAAGSDENFAGLQAAIGSLKDAVPDDLKDDVDVLSVAYGKLAALVAANGGDTETVLADPELQQQFAAIATDEVTAASDALDDYFDTVCPELNQS